MRRTELTALNKRLDKLEKNLARIQAFQEKGCPVGSMLHDIYAELNHIGEGLKNAKPGLDGGSDQELGVITLRHQEMLARFETLTNGVQTQSSGMVIASKSAIPDFFIRITGRYRQIWKYFERITAIFGVGIIGFTLIMITCFLAFGSIPYIRFPAGGTSLVNTLAFVLGVILGMLVHEFAHGIVLANNGIKIRQMGLMAGSIVGGFIEADEVTFFQADPRIHLRFNAASIGTNALLAVILGLIGLLGSFDLLIFLALGNLFFGFINSFPIKPLDGGWVYEDIVNLYLPNKKIKAFFLSARFGVFILWIALFTYSCL